MQMGRKVYTVRVVIEREPEAECFTAYAPSLAGCFRRGRTLVEAKESVRNAIRERLELFPFPRPPSRSCAWSVPPGRRAHDRNRRRMRRPRCVT